MRLAGREDLVPVLLILAAAIFTGLLLVLEQVEEIPRVPYELAEYAGVTPEDLGTAGLFDDRGDLTVSVRARRPGRVRFLVAGDGGGDHDAGKAALARRMRELCRRGGCDFVLFTGDNAYPDGVDTFGALPVAGAAGLDLQSRFLAGLDLPERQRLASRVRAVAGRTAQACGAVGDVARVGSAVRAGGGAVDSMAAEALRRHLQPKFERTFGWLAEERIPAFVVLGNHDWRSPFGAECEIGWSRRPGTAWRLPFYFYRIEVADPTGGVVAEILALYSAPPHAAPEGENFVSIGPRQGTWLARALARPAPGWRIALSHHPVWSAGGHTFLEYRSFHTDLLRLLEAAGTRLDLLLAGHNHWQESVRVPLGGEEALQVVSGSLSKVAFARMLRRGYPLLNLIALNPLWRAGMSGDLGTAPGAFLRRDRAVLTRGFALVELAGREGTVRFFGTGGELYAESFRRLPSSARAPASAASASRSTRLTATSPSRLSGNQRSGGRAGAGEPSRGEQTAGVRSSSRWE